MRPTQRAILMDAARHPDGITFTIHGHVTSRRQSSYGGRKQSAALALMEAGLLVRLRSTHSVHHLCHGLGSDHGYETIWQITEAGRTAAAKLGA